MTESQEQFSSSNYSKNIFNDAVDKVKQANKKKIMDNDIKNTLISTTRKNSRKFPDTRFTISYLVHHHPKLKIGMEDWSVITNNKV
jgi:predicted ester cyclase